MNLWLLRHAQPDELVGAAWRAGRIWGMAGSSFSL